MSREINSCEMDSENQSRLLEDRRNAEMNKHADLERLRQEKDVEIQSLKKDD